MLTTHINLGRNLFTKVYTQAKYVFIYRLFKNGKIEILHDNSHGKIKKKCFLSKQDIHGIYHKKAFENKRVVYDWFLTEDTTYFYKSTLIPLEDSLGRVESLFCIVKRLEGVSVQENENICITSDVGKSFVRLLMKVREEEKRKIISVFHDQMGSGAVMMNSLISILKNDLLEDKKDDALVRLQELEDTIKSIAQRMRKVIIAVRPRRLKEIGLVSAIRDLLDSLSSSSDMKFRFICDVPEEIKMSDEIKIVLYRFVQEAINNVFKHARAKNIWVNLKEKKGSIFLTVKDDGIGYKEIKSNSVKRMGLLGIRENVAYIGGTFDIKGEKGKGTVVSVCCPKISYVRKVI